MRYFRSTPAVYAGICQQLDTAYGYPNAETKTEQTLPDLAPYADGLVYLAINAAYCDYVLPSQLLADMLASGAVEEIDEQTYRATLPALPDA